MLSAQPSNKYRIITVLITMTRSATALLPLPERFFALSAGALAACKTLACTAAPAQSVIWQARQPYMLHTSAVNHL